MLIPVTALTAIPIPEAPPVINPAGVINAQIPSAKIKLPKIIINVSFNIFFRILRNYCFNSCN